MASRARLTTIALRIIRDLGILAACFIPLILGVVGAVTEGPVPWPRMLLALLGISLIGTAISLYLQFAWTFITEPLRGETDPEDSSSINRDA